MRTLIITIIVSLFYYITLPAQELIEKAFPLQENHKVDLNLKFAEDIKVENWEKNVLLIKAEVDINNNTLNDAHTIEVSHTDKGIHIVTGFDEAKLKNAKAENCNGNGRHQNNFNGKNGYSVCSKIKYTVYLPSNTDLKIESISGNISIAKRTGPVNAKSISGFVDLTTTPSQKADYFLKSISGEVYSNLDIEILNRQEHPLVGYELKGKLNGGGEIVKLESISGDIYLRKEKD